MGDFTFWISLSLTLSQYRCVINSDWDWRSAKKGKSSSSFVLSDRSATSWDQS